METKALEQKIAALISIIGDARALSRDMRVAAENIASHSSTSARVIAFKTRQ
jgi:hypothetical protein